VFFPVLTWDLIDVYIEDVQLSQRDRATLSVFVAGAYPKIGLFLFTRWHQYLAAVLSQTTGTLIKLSLLQKRELNDELKYILD